MWGVVFAVFILIWAWRSNATAHERSPPIKNVLTAGAEEHAPDERVKSRSRPAQASNDLAALSTSEVENRDDERDERYVGVIDYQDDPEAYNAGAEELRALARKAKEEQMLRRMRPVVRQTRQIPPRPLRLPKVEYFPLSPRPQHRWKEDEEVEQVDSSGWDQEPYIQRDAPVQRLKGSIRCDACDRFFADEQSLDRHNVKVHIKELLELSTREDKMSTERAIPCDFCDQVFDFSYHLRRHMSTSHLWATYCSDHLLFFRTAAQALDHYRSEHDESFQPPEVSTASMAGDQLSPEDYGSTPSVATPGASTETEPWDAATPASSLNESSEGGGEITSCTESEQHLNVPAEELYMTEKSEHEHATAEDTDRQLLLTARTPSPVKPSSWIASPVRATTPQPPMAGTVHAPEPESWADYPVDTIDIVKSKDTVLEAALGTPLVSDGVDDSVMLTVAAWQANLQPQPQPPPRSRSQPRTLDTTQILANGQTRQSWGGRMRDTSHSVPSAPLSPKAQPFNPGLSTSALRPRRFSRTGDDPPDIHLLDDYVIEIPTVMPSFAFAPIALVLEHKSNQTQSVLMSEPALYEERPVSFTKLGETPQDSISSQDGAHPLNGSHYERPAWFPVAAPRSKPLATARLAPSSSLVAAAPPAPSVVQTSTVRSSAGMTKRNGAAVPVRPRTSNPVSASADILSLSDIARRSHATAHASRPRHRHAAEGTEGDRPYRSSSGPGRAESRGGLEPKFDSGWSEVGSTSGPSYTRGGRATPVATADPWAANSGDSSSGWGQPLAGVSSSEGEDPYGGW